METFMPFIMALLYFMTLVMTIQLSWRLVQSWFDVTGEIEEGWDKPLPEDGQAQTTEIQRRTRLERDRCTLLKVSIMYSFFITVMPFVFGATIGVEFWAFSIVGLACLLAIVGRAIVHAWRRHERWLNRW